jgi:hypothetical protein
VTKTSDLDFQIKIAPKPQPKGVEVSDLPRKLVDALEKHWSELLGPNVTSEMIIEAGSAADAKRLALYAAAWGKLHDPKLYIKKLPNGKAYGETTARLLMQLDSDVPEDKRPGRRK